MCIKNSVKTISINMTTKKSIASLFILLSLILFTFFNLFIVNYSLIFLSDLRKSFLQHTSSTFLRKIARGHKVITSLHHALMALSRIGGCTVSVHVCQSFCFVFFPILIFSNHIRLVVSVLCVRKLRVSSLSLGITIVMQKRR